MTALLYNSTGTQTCPSTATAPAVSRTTNRQIRDFIKGKLENDDAWASMWLVAIYEEQTPLEQAAGETEERNGTGFSSYDAEFLSSLAEQKLQKGFLTRRQMECLHRKLPRYWKQVVDLMGREAVTEAMRSEPLQEEPGDDSTAQ